MRVHSAPAAMPTHDLLMPSGLRCEKAKLRPLQVPQIGIAYTWEKNSGHGISTGF
ncbi:predicted protein [Sclerotinia sclerotiorum 1980 UF-70]|uniref:Uncharacterized protein n=1 Tax=Sclerotinia sclerotiorum (strain ATCC 18683 / 1980 / Ss-1) TaxID=665079 RepID=A7F3Q8_SCLS1|nr:predicted protein [Sclerotinia sclerotiorum 1980 UF-70]EDN97379.1 predicted protein [Sclerotinia sclerotiorum 1980 UF-70]